MPIWNEGEPAGTEISRLSSGGLSVAKLAPAMARNRPSVVSQLGRQRKPVLAAAVTFRIPMAGSFADFAFALAAAAVLGGTNDEPIACFTFSTASWRILCSPFSSVPLAQAVPCIENSIPRKARQNTLIP